MTEGRGQDGFTLVELVIAILVFGLVMATVATAMVVMFRTTDETTQRLAESPELQIAAAYFGSDVQSAETFTGSCGPSSPAPLVTFAWTDPGGDPTTVGDSTRVVSYAVTTVGNQKELARHACVDGGPAETVTLVHHLQPTTTPSLVCSPDCTSPTTISVSMAICTADASNVCKLDPLPFELKATRRTT